MAPMLHTISLSIGYRSRVVASDINVSADKGELIALLGANGRGKSTLLRTLSGAQPPMAGEVRVGGRPIGQWDRRELARHVSLVYTDRTLAGGLTVEELVALGRQPHTGFFGRLSLEDREAVDSAMELTGIGDLRQRYVARLSDGERQKAMIAKALAQATPLIMMDEPTAFLDVASRLEIMSLLNRLADEEGKTILLSTHDVASATALAHRLWLFIPGAGDTTSIIEGRPERLAQSDPGLISLFPDRQVRFDQASGDFRPL